MSNINILDCTLRDGGYINDFNFGSNIITKIINQLTISNIDIIECGFLEDCIHKEDLSIFEKVEQIASHLPLNKKNAQYVAMACYGEYNLDKLSVYDGKSIDGIRVTFHYNEVDEALSYCKVIKEKGYKVFVQPVGTTSYSDTQLINLIEKVNELDPYAFYLVDTLGLMHKKDVVRMFYLIDHNLNSSINIGFHSHNNLQLSFSNCQELVHMVSDRTIILDSSVYGMGRGAGNLNTELIANYLNEQHYKYEIEHLLEIIDEFIVHIKAKFEWGYTVPYYLAAINGCHPSYASYLTNKQTLPIKSIGSILQSIETENRSLFDKKLIEQKYLNYQASEVDDSMSIKKLSKRFKNKNILIIASGASVNEYEKDIIKLSKEKECIIISVGFVPTFVETDFVFLSNLKRYNTTFNPNKKNVSLIYTSNIEIKENKRIQINYSSLLNGDDLVKDNSTLMLLNLLLKFDIKNIYLAGFDGYQVGIDNYCYSRLDLIQDKEQLMKQNKAIKQQVRLLLEKVRLSFITPSLYI